MTVGMSLPGSLRQDFRPGASRWGKHLGAPGPASAQSSPCACPSCSHSCLGSSLVNTRAHLMPPSGASLWFGDVTHSQSWPHQEQKRSKPLAFGESPGLTASFSSQPRCPPPTLAP